MVKSTLVKINCTLLFSVLTFSAHSLAGINAQLGSIIQAIAVNNITEANNNNPKAGKEICAASGRPSYECSGAITIGKGICLSGGRASYECSGATSIGKGICLASGRASYECSSATTIGKGICMASGKPGYECSSASSVAAGICMSKGKAGYECSNIPLSKALSMEVVDTQWEWDKFKDQYGNDTWRCRGEQTGQFANNIKCFGKLKMDNTWPG